MEKGSLSPRPTIDLIGQLPTSPVCRYPLQQDHLGGILWRQDLPTDENG